MTAQLLFIQKFNFRKLMLAILFFFATGIHAYLYAKPFIKALWVSKRTVTETPGIISTTVLDDYVAEGISVLFLNCEIPYDDWGFLDSMIYECHKRKIELHPYIKPGGQNREESLVVKNHPEWLVVELDGSRRTNLNLANMEARSYVLAVADAMLKHDIDGLHLDYIRFDLYQNFSYDSLTCDQFKKRYGVSPMDLDKDCGDPLWCEWINWNGDQVTQLVIDIRKSIVRSGKKIPLSAAVFPDAEVAQIMIGQDWEKWVEDGLLDLVCPMLYIENSEVFTKQTRDAMRICRKKADVYIGIWLGYRYHRDVDPELMLEHSRIALREGANGIAFWSGASFRQEYREKLRELKTD
jgi:uncharacterized lipoprotein YddW (UPF0748 family)